MSLFLQQNEKIARLRSDLRMGAGIIIRDGAVSWVAFAAETLSSARFEQVQILGQAELVITDWRAQTLKTWASDGDIARILVPQDASLQWVTSMADPSDDLSHPLKGPFNLSTSGSADAQRAVLNLCKQAHLLPAAVLARLPADGPSDFFQINLVELTDAIQHPSPLHAIAAASVPLQVSKNAQVHVFRPDDGGVEHYAIEVGSPSRGTPVLARLHSACFTGDLMGSLKCDCGAQLAAAMSAMGAAGEGVLLYMNQEGRGIGLANKMRAYSLQDQGFDTVEANHRLGFEDDERDFKLGAEILREMGFSSVRLMTNNPAKVEKMRAGGVEVTERVPLNVGENPVNAAYLRTKAAKSGHIL